jgi:sigma-B regulation protein RsbU (phosphoserine phosphatase)
MFPTTDHARKRRRFAIRWTRDNAFLFAEVLLLLGSLALLFAGFVQKWPATYPATLSMLAAGVAITHVMSVRRTKQLSVAERMFESMPMIDLSQAVRNARSVDGLYESLIKMVGNTFPSKAISLFVRDDDTGHFPCRISTALFEPAVAGAIATPILAKDAFVVRRLRGLDMPMQLDDGDLRAWKEALVDAPREVFEKRMRERDTLERTNSSMLVQLKTRSDLVGVLSLGGSTTGQYSQKDQQLLKTLGGQLALIIENAKLLERMVEHQRLQAELEVAAEVQRSLLPTSTPQLQEFDLCGFCKTAQQVGGDYYDFIPLSDECTGIAIADVAGKGIAAALMMSVVQASLRGQLLSTAGRGPLSEMVSLVNRLVTNSVSTARYVTFFYSQLDRKTGNVRFVNAGHNPPMHYSASQKTIAPLTTGGSVLGLFSTASFEEGVAALDADDVLVAYTDGVTEAEDTDGTEFGEDRLRELIGEIAGGSAKEILDAIIGRVTEWSRGTKQHDDITVVVLKRS